MIFLLRAAGILGVGYPARGNRQARPRPPRGGPVGGSRGLSGARWFHLASGPRGGGERAALPLAGWIPALALAACGPAGGAELLEVPPGCVGQGTEGATASCLSPSREPAYYIDEALKYFDTLDVSADRDRVPDYHPQVARWEWPPWLLLTGYGAQDMTATADVLRVIDPSTVPFRDCRFFEVQPFARCYVVFEYEGGPCPIYEEFVFDSDGRTTFIEAWSDLPGLLPHTDPADPWAERHEIGRLSTRIPGLGTPSGTIDLFGAAMKAAADEDPDVADFVTRAYDWRAAWVDELAGADPDFFAQGCGW